MVFFNLPGAVEAIIAVAIGFMIFGEGSGFAMAGIIWVVIDLVYRKVRQGEYDDFPWFAPRRGGQIMFVPGWMWGIILFFLGAFGWA